MPMDVETHTALGLDQPTPDPVNGRSNTDILASLDHERDNAYAPCPEAMQDSAPVGFFERTKNWRASTVYPNTVRDIAVYLPPLTIR